MAMADDPLMRMIDMHGRAWTAWAEATRDLVELPLRSITTLVGAPEAPAVDADLPAAAVAELMRRLEATQDALGLAERRREQAEALVGEVREAYARFEAEIESRLVEATEAQALALYQLLEPLLTQLPAVRHSLAEGREVAAADVLALLGPLDAAVAALGLRAIGEVGAEVAFDPALHQASGAEPQPGAPMAVRQVGYRLGDRLLRRARVVKVKAKKKD